MSLELQVDSLLSEPPHHINILIIWEIRCGVFFLFFFFF